jgi:aminoglycoside 3-N-acetyltransferase
VVPLILASVLEQLDVPRSSVVYVQSSTDWLARAGIDAGEALKTLREWVMPSGTLVMPSYPFRVTHLEYLQSSPRYDVRTSPSMIGLIPELFRRSDGVCRSLDPDFAIAAEGDAAGEIVATHLADPDPFGRQSVYENVIARDATMIGLGVSLNTNSFIHVIDSRLAVQYRRSPYENLHDAQIVDYTGAVVTVQRRALAPDFQRLTKPSAVVEGVGGDRKVFAAESINGATFFRWRLQPWARWCEAHGRVEAAAGRWPCWLRLLDGGVS